jgi:hypothetical protein
MCCTHVGSGTNGCFRVITEAIQRFNLANDVLILISLGDLPERWFLLIRSADQRNLKISFQIFSYLGHCLKSSTLTV